MKIATLEDVCYLNMGQSPDSSTYNEVGEGLPFYQGNADFGEKHPHCRVWCSEPTKIAEKEDILISVRAPIGALNEANERCCIGRGLAAIRPKGKINKDFLYYFLLSKKSYLISKGTGSTFKAISKNVLGKLSIPVPAMHEQEKRARILNTLWKVIYTRRVQLAKLDELIKCRFVEMFGDPVLNEKGWTCSQLGDVASVIGGYAFSSKQFAAAGIPVLRIGNINTGTFRKENLVFWSEDEKLTKYLIYPGDIVISLTGTAGKEDYGNVCVMSDDYPKYYLNQRNAVIRPTSSLLPSFLSYYMKSPVIKRKMTGIERGIRQGNISNSDITSLRIPMPPIYLQENFTHMVHRIDKLRVSIQASLDKTQQLFDSLMQEYFD